MAAIVSPPEHLVGLPSGSFDEIASALKGLVMQELADQLNDASGSEITTEEMRAQLEGTWAKLAALLNSRAETAFSLERSTSNPLLATSEELESSWVTIDEVPFHQQLFKKTGILAVREPDATAAIHEFEDGNIVFQLGPKELVSAHPSTIRRPPPRDAETKELIIRMGLRPASGANLMLDKRAFEALNTDDPSATARTRDLSLFHPVCVGDEGGIYMDPQLTRHTSAEAPPTLRPTNFTTAICMFGPTLLAMNGKGATSPLIKHYSHFYGDEKIVGIHYSPRDANPYEEAAFASLGHQISLMKQLSEGTTPNVTVHLPYIDYMLFGIELYLKGRIALTALNVFFKHIIEKKKALEIKLAELGQRTDVNIVVKSPFGNLLPETIDLDALLEAYDPNPSSTSIADILLNALDPENKIDSISPRREDGGRDPNGLAPSPSKPYRDADEEADAQRRKDVEQALVETWRRNLRTRAKVPEQTLIWTKIHESKERAIEIAAAKARAATERARAAAEAATVEGELRIAKQAADEKVKQAKQRILNKFIELAKLPISFPLLDGIKHRDFQEECSGSLFFKLVRIFMNEITETPEYTEAQQIIEENQRLGREKGQIKRELTPLKKSLKGGGLAAGEHGVISRKISEGELREREISEAMGGLRERIKQVSPHIRLALDIAKLIAEHDRLSSKAQEVAARIPKRRDLADDTDGDESGAEDGATIPEEDDGYETEKGSIEKLLQESNAVLYLSNVNEAEDPWKCAALYPATERPILVQIHTLGLEIGSPATLVICIPDGLLTFSNVPSDPIHPEAGRGMPFYHRSLVDGGARLIVDAIRKHGLFQSSQRRIRRIDEEYRQEGLHASGSSDHIYHPAQQGIV